MKSIILYYILVYDFTTEAYSGQSEENILRLKKTFFASLKKKFCVVRKKNFASLKKKNICVVEKKRIFAILEKNNLRC